MRDTKCVTVCGVGIGGFWGCRALWANSKTAGHCNHGCCNIATIVPWWQGTGHRAKLPSCLRPTCARFWWLVPFCTFSPAVHIFCVHRQCRAATLGRAEGPHLEKNSALQPWGRAEGPHLDFFLALHSWQGRRPAPGKKLGICAASTAEGLHLASLPGLPYPPNLGKLRALHPMTWFWALHRPERNKHYGFHYNVGYVAATSYAYRQREKFRSACKSLRVAIGRRCICLTQCTSQKVRCSCVMCVRS